MVNCLKRFRVVASTLSLVLLFECVPMAAWGLTLNTQSLGGLLGNLTDNSDTNILKKNTAKKEFMAPQKIWAASVRDTSMYIYWSSALNNTGTVEYNLYMNGALVKTTMGKNAKVTGLTKGQEYTFYVVARDKATNKTVRGKTLKQKTENYTATTQKRDNDIATMGQKANNLFAKYISEPITAKITSDTSRVGKIAWGTLEGIPKTFKDVGMLGYSAAKYLTPDNALASGMVNYTKLKNDPCRTIINAGLSVVALPAVLYQESAKCLTKARQDDRYAGNLLGEIGTGIGSLKALSKLPKIASIAAQAPKTNSGVNLLKTSKVKIGVLGEDGLKISQTKIATGLSPTELLAGFEKDLVKASNIGIQKKYGLPVAPEVEQATVGRLNRIREVLGAGGQKAGDVLALEKMYETNWILCDLLATGPSKTIQSAIKSNQKEIRKISKRILED